MGKDVEGNDHDPFKNMIWHLLGETKEYKY